MTPTSGQQTPPDTVQTTGASRLQRLDQWAASHPANPRFAPWFVYMIFLAGQTLAHESAPELHGPIKIVQTAVVCWLIWRWRKLTPELTWSFHWLVIPVSLFLTAAWIGLGAALDPYLGADEPPKVFWGIHHPALAWAAAVCHLLAMMTAVPMIEEMFNRSLLLRCLQSPRQTGVGAIQFLCDLPGVGDWLIHTRLGVAATKAPAALTEQFNRTVLGELSIFGVLASSMIFALVHVMRDWPAAVLCGVVWCVMLRITRRKGLGPVIWSHALTNLLLWAHVIYHGGNEWRFM